jgi:hypothetical protein
MLARLLSSNVLKIKRAIAPNLLSLNIYTFNPSRDLMLSMLDIILRKGDTLLCPPLTKQNLR